MFAESRYYGVCRIEKSVSSNESNETENGLGARNGEVAKHGRTVLFISHNMAAVKSLTTTGIVLAEGCVRFNGTAEAAVQAYVQMADSTVSSTTGSWGRGTHTTIRAVRLLNSFGESTGQYVPGEPLGVEVEVETDGAP